MNLYKAVPVPDSCRSTVRNGNGIRLAFLPVSKARTTTLIIYFPTMYVYIVYLYIYAYTRCLSDITVGYHTLFYSEGFFVYLTTILCPNVRRQHGKGVYC